MLTSRHHELFTALRKITRAVDLHSRSLMASHGLTLPQLSALRFIAANEGATPSDLSEAISLSAGTVTGIVQRLEVKELVDRERDGDDKRKSQLTLTAAGRQMIESSPPPIHDAFSDRFHEMEDWEQSQMIATLQKLAGMMNPAEPEPNEAD